MKCASPSFGDYINYVIERDLVNFNWEDVLDRRPRFDEYMAYIDTVKDLDVDTRNLFSFRSVLSKRVNCMEHNTGDNSSTSDRCVQLTYMLSYLCITCETVFD